MMMLRKIAYFIKVQKRKETNLVHYQRGELPVHEPSLDGCQDCVLTSEPFHKFRNEA